MLKHTLAYCSGDPTPEQVRDFFGYIDRGIPVPLGHDTELILAWKLWQSRQPGKGEKEFDHLTIQEEMWLEGNFSGDYPLAAVTIDFIKDGAFERQRPAYIDLCRLRYRVKSGGHHA